MTDPGKIRQSIRFAEAQHRALDEADAARDAQARRRELIRDLGARGAFSDERLRSLVHARLGSAAWSDEALGLLDGLLKVLAVGRKADDGQA